MDGIEKVIMGLKEYKPESKLGAEYVDQAIFYLEQLQQYESIGTFEEFRKLSEKAKAKPLNGEVCPDCGTMICDRNFRYCTRCGQKIDWRK